MANTVFKSLTALGHEAPQILAVAGYKIVERFDVALASIAVRRGRERDFAKSAKATKLVLPPPAQAEFGSPYCAFWLSSEHWMIEAPYDTHEDISSILKAALGDAASITEQTDAWVRFDISGTNVHPLFEKLCNVDLQLASIGYAGRTVVEHIGCYLIKRREDEITLYGPRSMAASLLHILEVTANSLA